MTEMGFYLSTAGCLFIGVFMAYLFKMRELAALARAANKPVPRPYEYYRNFPYQTAISALSSLVGYVLLLEMNELTMITAFGMGIVGEGISNAAAARAKNVLEID